MQVDPQALATLTIGWDEGGQSRRATLTIAVDGMPLDDALDLVQAGFEDNPATKYTVVAGEIEERVTRPRDQRKPRPARPSRPGRPQAGEPPDPVVHDEPRQAPKGKQP